MKRKIVKKVFAVLLTAVMSFSIIGCGKNEQSEVSGDNTVVTDSAEESTETSTETSTEEATTESSTEEDLGAYTNRTDANGIKIVLGGIEVIIRDWWSGDGTRPEATDAYGSKV